MSAASEHGLFGMCTHPATFSSWRKPPFWSLQIKTDQANVCETRSPKEKAARLENTVVCNGYSVLHELIALLVGVQQHIMQFKHKSQLLLHGVGRAEVGRVLSDSDEVYESEGGLVDEEGRAQGARALSADSGVIGAGGGPAESGALPLSATVPVHVEERARVKGARLM